MRLGRNPGENVFLNKLDRFNVEKNLSECSQMVQLTEGEFFAPKFLYQINSCSEKLMPQSFVCHCNSEK
jgi:hypothetical protein